MYSMRVDGRTDVQRHEDGKGNLSQLLCKCGSKPAEEFKSRNLVSDLSKRVRTLHIAAPVTD
jgi:hypothetical protein